jgi:hypothetical protein
MMPLLRLAGLACLLAASPIVHAQDIRTVPVRFAPGATSAVLKGVITGRDSISYTVSAEAGQTLRVLLTSSTPSLSFNLYAPGRGPGSEAMAIGDLLPQANRFEGKLDVSGAYTVNVFLIRAAARRNTRSRYTLEISIPAGAAAKPLDLAPQCRRFAAVDFATTPARIRTAGTRPGPEGSLVDATADLGKQGVKPFACRFDAAGRYLGIFSKVDEGKL